ncbi:YgjP-like metallopeptidase domain-containing protein [Cerasibacillus sp.]|uniref:YgjP-like metallopeptidase domain-containing protein n=1 Tax=Cerasibacillus sp. TaxID=2498711 RepID=UPI0039C86A3A
MYTFEKMNVRWGSSLTHERKIILNIHLIIVQKHCIDYVVLHELLHLKYPDHDYHFFNQPHMSDWRNESGFWMKKW